MKTFYIIDWLINKPIKINMSQENFNENKIKIGDKILYKLQDSNQEFIGTYLGYGCDTIKSGNFIKKLSLGETQKFNQNQEKAKELFKLFKKDFKENFSESVPISARMDLSGKNVYFYFYAELRFQFGDFLRNFRKKIGMNFFLFQIGARDRVRFSESADNIYGTCGQLLCCKKSMCPLPTVDSENIIIQNLENRGVEKMKGRCGKLKCCLNYEKDIYFEKSKSFPRKGDMVKYQGKELKVYGFSILNGEIIAKDEKEDITFKVTIDEVKVIRINNGTNNIQQEELEKIKKEYKDLEG